MDNCRSKAWVKSVLWPELSATSSLDWPQGFKPSCYGYSGGPVPGQKGMPRQLQATVSWGAVNPNTISFSVFFKKSQESCLGPSWAKCLCSFYKGRTVYLSLVIASSFYSDFLSDSVIFLPGVGGTDIPRIK